MKEGMYATNYRHRPSKSPQDALSLAEAFRLTRLECRLTQSRAAELIGTRQSRISEYETGYRTPSKRTINKWLVAINGKNAYYQKFMKLYRMEFLRAHHHKKVRLNGYIN